MDINTTLSQADKQTLVESSLFKGLPPKEMSPILAATKIRTYNAGQTILSSGAIGEGIYVILEGQVNVFLPEAMSNNEASSTSDGSNASETPHTPDVKISLATLEPGACFGEYSLVDQGEVSATVQALTPVRISFVSTSDFYQIASTHLLAESIIYKNLLRILVSRCRKANKELDPDALIY